MGNNKVHLSRIRSWLVDNPAVIASLALIILLGVAVPQFGTSQNILTVLQQMSVYGISAVGLAFVLICGGNDLSIGANITFSSIMAALFMTSIFPEGGAVVGVLAALATGCVVGLVNGVMVAKIGVNPFMMTLIMSMLLEGLSIILTNATAIGGLPTAYVAIGSIELAYLPLPLWILILFYVFGQFVLKKTVAGRKIYASGSNKKTAQLVGIKTDKMLIGTYIFCGMCASVAGIILSARLAAATPASGTSLMLDVMSAALIGGCSLFGGKGSVLGAAAGVLLLSLVSNGLNLIGVSYNTTLVIKGVIILLAVILDASKGKWGALGKRKVAAK